MREFIIKDDVLEKYNGNDEEVIVPEGVKKIGDMVFAGNENVKSVLLPAGLEELGYSCFKQCSNLEDIVMPSSLEVIKDKAFSECTHLQSIQLPEKIKAVPSDCFYECCNLKKATLPEGLESIGMSAFRGCMNLEEIQIPDSVFNIKADAFSLTGLWGTQPELASHQGLKEVVLPKSLKILDMTVFSGQINLEKITFPDSLQSIYNRAFKYCTKLKIDYLPETLKRIGNEAISDCILGPGCRIPDEEVEDWKLYPWAQGEEVIVPEHIHKIGSLCFYGNPQLRRIKLSSVSQIDADAFKNCPNLEAVEFSNHLRSIGYSAFENCNSLKQMILPDSIEQNGLGTALFRNCTSLTELHLPDSLISLPAELCSGCSSLEQIYIPGECREIGGSCFYECIKLKDIVFPKILKKIDNSSFEGCLNLKSAILSQNVEFIGNKAFKHSGLNHIELLNPDITINGCDWIGECYDLKTVRIHTQDYWKDSFCHDFSKLTGSAALVAPHIADAIKLSEIRDPSLKHSLCYGYSTLKEEGKVFSEEFEKEYLGYIKRQRKDFLYGLPKHPAMLRLMIQNQFLSSDQLKELLENENINSCEELRNLIQQEYEQLSKTKKTKKPKKKKASKESIRKKLFAAVEQNDLSAIRELAENYDISKDCTVRYGNANGSSTLLESALALNNIAVIQYLVKNVSLESPEISLSAAIQQQNLEAANIILKGKVDPAKGMASGDTPPLAAAVEAGNMELIQRMFKKKSKAPESVLLKCFQISLEKEIPEITQYLLERITKIEKLKNDTYDELVEAAVVFNDQHSLEKLVSLRNNTLHPNSPAMAIALRKGDLESVKKLFEESGIQSSMDLLDVPHRRVYIPYRDAYMRRRIQKTDYGQYADDDFKAVFNRAGQDFKAKDFYAFNEMYDGRNNRFEGLYKDIPLMEEHKMAEFLCRLADEKICSDEDMQYFWFLAVLGDFMEAAAALERRGWASPEKIDVLKKKATISRKMNSILDLAVPGMSVKKGQYILKQLEEESRKKKSQGIEFSFGTGYFTGNPYDLDLFVKLTESQDLNQFHITSKKSAVESCIKANHLEGLKRLEQFGAITKQNIQSFIDLAENENHLEIKLWLMNYQDEHLQTKASDLTL